MHDGRYCPGECVSLAHASDWRRCTNGRGTDYGSATQHQGSRNANRSGRTSSQDRLAKVRSTSTDWKMILKTHKTGTPRRTTGLWIVSGSVRREHPAALTLPKARAVSAARRAEDRASLTRTRQARSSKVEPLKKYTYSYHYATCQLCKPLS